MSTNPTMANPMAMPVAGGAPEAQIARHLTKLGLSVAPLLAFVGFLFWGLNGVWSVGYGLAIVLVNFLLSAAIITFCSRISLTLLMMGVMFGFLIRLGLVTIAVLLVKDAGWMELVPLCITIIVTHLGLLFWELRYVSASLAFPGLKPAKDGR
ncbi:MAG: hypothetical protein JWL70_1417 [Acidimicrobiia bacterium]|nr:hypothetical protein [Acidimicrobiia bacterium]